MVVVVFFCIRTNLGRKPNRNYVKLLGIMHAHPATAKQSETPARARVLSQKICIYIYSSAHFREFRENPEMARKKNFSNIFLKGFLGSYKIFKTTFLFYFFKENPNFLSKHHSEVIQPIKIQESDFFRYFFDL